MNKVLLTLIAFVTYMIMSGLMTQIGVILNAFAADINYSAKNAIAIFSYLTGGALIGTFIALGLYSRYTLSTVMKTCYLVFLLVMVILVSSSASYLWIVKSCFLILGICCGCGLSGGAVIISKIYNDSKRASAFIATDCSFSAAGYLFPTLAAWLLLQGVNWTWSYAAVGGLAVILLFLLFIVRYPETEASQANSKGIIQQLISILQLRVILMGIGVCAYLIAQTTFLSWAPNYLQETFALSADSASQVVGNYWGLSIFGLISSAILIHKISARWMLMTAVILAVCMTLFFVFTTNSDHFLMLSFALGFFTTCIYKIAMAIGSQQIPNAPAMLVTFLLFSGGIGSATAPVLSGIAVNLYGVQGALKMSAWCFVLVLIMFSSCLLIEKQANKSALN